MTERVGWDELPGELREAVERRTGPVSETLLIEEGLNCSTAMTITTAHDGLLFLKGVRENDECGAAALHWEESLNRTVAGIGPRLLHSVRAGGWHCLAFRHVPGRHADLGPGTRDLTAVTAALHRMTRLRVPPGLTVPPLTSRFTPHLAPGEADLLAGDHLLHTDTNPHNILIAAPDGAAHIIDWAMPATGPSWIDPAYTAVRLMECGQPPSRALSWLSAFPTWRHADPKAVESFVNLTCRHWTSHIGPEDAAPSNARFRQLLPRG